MLVRFTQNVAGIGVAGFSQFAQLRYPLLILTIDPVRGNLTTDDAVLNPPINKVRALIEESIYRIHTEEL